MFSDKVAIVTGGAQGIGRAIVEHFLKNKAAVVVVDADEEAGKETINELHSFGKIIFLHTDLSTETEIQKIIDMTVKNFNRVDFVVNNAGIFLKKAMEELSLFEWNNIIRTNLTAPFLLAKYAAPFLKHSHGAIVNIASTRAKMSEPHTEAYTASKGGMVALTHALAISLGPDVRVNSISPGWIETVDWKKKSQRGMPHHTQADLMQHPVGRVGKPEDIAALVGYLVSPQASFITGENFVIDGGMTHKMIYV